MNPVNKILLGLGAAVALIIGAVFVWLFLANAHLQAKLAQAEAGSTACYLANQEFAVQVARQNEAVEVLKAERLKRAQAASYEAQKTMRAHFLAAEELRKVKSRGGTCEAAENILNNYVSKIP